MPTFYQSVTWFHGADGKPITQNNNSGIVTLTLTRPETSNKDDYPHSFIDKDENLNFSHAWYELSSFINSDKVSRFSSGIVIGTDAIATTIGKAQVINHILEGEKILKGDKIASKAFESFTHSGTIVGAIAGGIPAIIHLASGNGTWRDGASLAFAVLGVASEFTGLGEAYDGSVGAFIAASSLSYDIWDATHPAN